MRILSFPITFGSLTPPGCSGRKELQALTRRLSRNPEQSAGSLTHTQIRFPAAELSFVRVEDPVLRRHSLLHDLADGSGAYGVPAFADGKPQALLHRHRRDQLDHQ